MPKKKIVPDSSGGEVILDSPPTQISPSKQWCFTYNNYLESDIVPILSIFKEKAELYVFQEEIGECGTPHLQGNVIFNDKIRPIKLFEGITNKIRWSKTNNLRASIKYCCKEDTRNGRIFANFPYPKPLKLLSEDKFYEWQIELNKILESEPDERKIHWYVDETGNCGKSVFSKYLVIKKHAIVLCGKASDMKNGILMYEKNKGFYPEIIIIDIPRTFDSKYLSYTGIEEIKNGCFFSPKYEGGMCVFNCPHIIVFSNEEPCMDNLSKDRWVVKHI